MKDRGREREQACETIFIEKKTKTLLNTYVEAASRNS